MKKNIKKIISTILVVISIFTLVGCGKTKEELKEEIKQEMKVEEEQARQESEEKSKLENTNNIISKEDFNKFKELYEEYKTSMFNIMTISKFKEGETGYITIEESKKIKVKSDEIKEELLSVVSPNKIKNNIEVYTKIYDEYYRIYAENDVSKMKNSYEENLGQYTKELDKIISEYELQLDK